MHKNMSILYNKSDDLSTTTRKIDKTFHYISAEKFPPLPSDFLLLFRFLQTAHHYCLITVAIPDLAALHFGPLVSDTFDPDSKN